MSNTRNRKFRMTCDDIRECTNFVSSRPASKSGVYLVLRLSPGNAAWLKNKVFSVTKREARKKQNDRWTSAGQNVQIRIDSLDQALQLLDALRTLNSSSATLGQEPAADTQPSA